MNKRKLHHLLVVLRQVKAWQLVVALVVLLAASILFLRQNNLTMIELRNLVLQADEQNKDIPVALSGLQMYIAGHMNTSMGEAGVYLEHSYQRAYDAAVERASSAGADSALPIQFPATELYRFNYEAPFWSPDFAGLTVLATVLVTLIIVLRLLLIGVVYGMLRWRQ